MFDLVCANCFVGFLRVDAFEYTQELDAFNMLGVSLYHGWLVDEQDAMMVRFFFFVFCAWFLLARAVDFEHSVRFLCLMVEQSEVIGNQSYNQLVEKVITYKAITSPMISRDPAARKSAPAPDERKSSATETPVQDKPKAEQEQEEVVVDITTLPSLYQPASTTPAENKTEELPPPSPAEEPQQRAEQPEPQPPVHEAPNPQELLEGRLAQQFFAENPSQLTFHGLAKLHERMRERELAVFFRNNHFSTIFKVPVVSWPNL